MRPTTFSETSSSQTTSSATTSSATTSRPPNCSPFGPLRTRWTDHREASLNWLALGLLLAAWNATSDDAPSVLERRPPELRGYASVSVRAAQRIVARRS